MYAVFLRDIIGYFRTMRAYVFLTWFLLCSGILISVDVFLSRAFSVSNLLNDMCVIMIAITPILTMRSLYTAPHIKNDMVLFINPISTFSIIVGEFLAIMLVVLCAVAGLGIYTIALSFFFKIAFAETLLAFFGFLLMCSAFVAIGILVASITHNSISAFIGTIGLLLLLWMTSLLIPSTEVPFLDSLLTLFAVFKHFEPFKVGLLRPSSILYLITSTVLMLAISAKILEKRRGLER